MIYSMTGYGQAIGEFGDKQIQVELKSLNGKSTELRLRVPSTYKNKELIIRQYVLDKAQRGKLDASITFLSAEVGEGFQINKKLFKKYFNEMDSLRKELNIEGGDLVQSIMRIPDVVMAAEVPISDAEWKVVEETLAEAVKNFLIFREDEGEAMANDLRVRASNIEVLLEDTTEFEEQRIETVKTRLRKHLDLYVGSEKVDENRFEQELIFYMEKLDITEEKVRLKQHCKYFKEILDNKDEVVGKKLAFIGQEMGREINTLGAKSQNSELQQIVVNMKDELEKIKEQLANIV